MSMEGWSGDNGDPDNFLGILWGSQNIPTNNWAHYRNPQVDKLLAQALVVADQAKRAELYKQVQRIVLDDAPWIFINSTLQIRAMRKNVEGFQLNPTQMFFDMQNVSLK